MLKEVVGSLQRLHADPALHHLLLTGPQLVQAIIKRR